MAALAALAPMATWAHDIPRSVTVRAFVRPTDSTLRFLVRAPLEAMRDQAFPTTGAGYLDLERAGPTLRLAAAQWIGDYVEFVAGGVALGDPRLVAIRVSLPSDRSFQDYDSAFARVTGPPLPASVELPWRQALLDVLFEYRISNPEARFSIRPSFGHLGIRTTTVLRFLPIGKAERAYQFVGDPGEVRLDPRWHQAAWRFVVMGFDHILDGFDHLLFLLGLIIPFRRFWNLVPVITAFTVAHSITLLAAAGGLTPDALWFPALIETAIALSVVLMAIENGIGAKPGRRWWLAFFFGLVHGFGFSFALRENLQFAGGHLLTSLLAFNVGVELGQLAVVMVAVPILNLLLRRVVAERVGIILLSIVVGHTAWHWMVERGRDLLQYQLTVPAVDASLLASVSRWLLLIAVIGAAGWALRGIFTWWDRRQAELVSSGRAT